MHPSNRPAQTSSQNRKRPSRRRKNQKRRRKHKPNGRRHQVSQKRELSPQAKDCNCSYCQIDHQRCEKIIECIRQTGQLKLAARTANDQADVERAKNIAANINQETSSKSKKRTVTSGKRLQLLLLPNRGCSP